MKRCALFFTVFTLLFTFTLSYCPQSPAAEDQKEKILFFGAKAKFIADGSMQVEETIRFIALGKDIKRGMVRDLPLVWKRQDGKHYSLQYDILHVTREGTPEPYSVNQDTQTISIRIGNPEILLSPGEHEYHITYTIRNHFSRFTEWDELYWNVTGNGWEFPIDVAYFSLSFAPGIVQGPYSSNYPWQTIDAYTGYIGERGNDAIILPDGSVITATPLLRRQGLTVAYTWPSNLLANAPTPEERSFIKQHILPSSKPVSIVYWFVPLLATLYYIIIWHRMRSQRDSQTIVPLYSVPKGLTPGKIRQIYYGLYDDTGFAADMLRLVSKGGMKVSEKKTPQKQGFWSSLFTRDVFTLQRGSDNELNREDRHVLKILFTSGNTLTLNATAQKPVQSAYKYCSTKANERSKGLFIKSTSKWFRGAALYLLFPLLLGILVSIETGFIILFIFTFLSVFMTALSFFTKTVLPKDTTLAEIVSSGLSLIWVSIFWFAFVSMLIGFSPAILALPLPQGFIGAFSAFLIVTIIGYATAPKYTAEGLKLLVIAKGLAMYIRTAEKDRFEILYSPEKQIEHFEKLLPYALVLGLGKTWANRFSKYLEHSGLEPHNLNSLSSWRGVHRFSRISSSSAAISSRSGNRGSGSRGGGSSGRGSGGGGGRGW